MNKNPNSKLTFWLWLGVTILLAGIVGWASLKFAKVENAIRYLDTKEVQKIVQKELQPIYTTIEGEKGPKGDDGKDSLSTHTITEKETTIITQEQIQGPQGEAGKPGPSYEFLVDINGRLVGYRVTGNREWEIPSIFGGGNE